MQVTVFALFMRVLGIVINTEKHYFLRTVNPQVQGSSPGRGSQNKFSMNQAPKFVRV
jgi:hypothetical protein